MNLLIMAAALVAAITLETLAPAPALLGQAHPPLMLAVVLYYALARSPALMLAAALAGGLLSDSLNMLPLGYSSLCLALAGWLVSRHRDLFFSGHWLTHLVCGALGGMVVTLGMYLLLIANDAVFRAWSPGPVLLKILGTGLYGLLTVPLVFQALARLDRLAGNQPGAIVE